MEFQIVKMSEKYATEILCWKYEKPYDFYNNVLSGEGILELTQDTYKAILHDKEVVGFYCTGKDAQVPAGNEVHAYDETCLDIGLGMRPDLTGKGRGTAFLDFILKQIEAGGCVRLTVADFNKRAIRLYEKFGFQEKLSFWRHDIKFNVMVKK